MVVGMISVNTCHGKTDIPVEVLDKGPRPGTVWVKALDGIQPFTKISHGGPYQDDEIVVPLAFVQDIHLNKDPDERLGEEITEEPGAKAHILAPDWLLESAYEERTSSE